MEILAISILILFCIAGFAAIFFTTIGTMIMLIGFVIYTLLSGISAHNIKALIIILILYLIGEVLEFVFIVVGTKKYGASNMAVIGALVGGFLGAMAGTALFGIGIFLGTLLGIFLGAFIAEFFVKKDIKKSFEAGKGGILGRLGSIIAKIAIAFIMFIVMAVAVAGNIT